MLKKRDIEKRTVICNNSDRNVAEVHHWQHTSANTHARTHARTHACMHAHAHTHAHTQAHTHTHIQWALIYPTYLSGNLTYSMGHWGTKKCCILLYRWFSSIIWFIRQVLREQMTLDKSVPTVHIHTCTNTHTHARACTHTRLRSPCPLKGHKVPTHAHTHALTMAKGCK